MIDRNLPLPSEYEIQNYMDDDKDDHLLFAQHVENEHEARFGNMALQNRAREKSQKTANTRTDRKKTCTTA